MSVAAGPDVTPATRKVRILSSDSVSKHNKLDDVWVIHKNNVYDVTDFVLDHPGGEDLIMRFAGKDMANIMEDPEEHSHSDSAFELLEEYYLGRLASSQEEQSAIEKESKGGAGLVNEEIRGLVITDDFKPSETASSEDFKKYQFLDLNKPLIMQVWNSKFSKDHYLKQVHSPRHLKEPARLFGPAYLEVFTRTPWYVVPMIWLPIAAALFHRSAAQFSTSQKSNFATGLTSSDSISTPFSSSSSISNSTLLSSSSSLSSSSLFNLPGLQPLEPLALLYTSACWIAGVFIWTVLEYALHRFLFHVDDYLPDRPEFLTLHFLLHGIHHYLPMDRMRLVMPPLLFAALSYPFTVLGHALFPASVANGIISGAFTMYVGYDTMHYALHHTKLPAYIKSMKKYHLEHHYKNYELGFGVTSRFWDWVFGTEL